MRRANNTPVYNSRILKMPSTLVRTLGLAACSLCMMLYAPKSFSTDWSGPEQQLAGKIAAAIGPGAFAINVVNRSSLSHSDLEQIHRGLLAALEGLGVRAASADSATGTVDINLSEGLRNYVWVAEIHQGTNQPQVMIVSFPRPDATLRNQAAFPMSIRRKLIWTSATQILDIGLFDEGAQHMIVLGPESVVLYQFQEGRWQQEQSLPVSHAHPWPRDLRGRLALRKDHLFDAYLPGVFCRSTSTTPLALNCHESDDPWPLGTNDSGQSGFFASTRNFYTGAISPGIGKQVTAQPFYSAAAVPREKYELWILDGVDGQIQLLDGFTNRSAGALGWGSDIASVHSGCGLGSQILVTASSDVTGDAIRAHEIADREFTAVSQPIEFAGKITALSTGSDGNSVIAISQIAETGEYEADQLSIACGQ